MQFTVKARVLKQVWSGGESFLYQIEELDKKKKWSVWIKQPLQDGQSYDFSGYVSESKDKKVKDEKGYDIWRATFNVESVGIIEGFVDHGAEPSFNNSEDIPY